VHSVTGITFLPLLGYRFKNRHAHLIINVPTWARSNHYAKQAVGYREKKFGRQKNFGSKKNSISITAEHKTDMK
jgi:hypothetical protein